MNSFSTEYSTLDIYHVLDGGVMEGQHSDSKPSFSSQKCLDLNLTCPPSQTFGFEDQSELILQFHDL